jgi:cysteine synthase
MYSIPRFTTGIGAGFIPVNCDMKLVDEVVQVTSPFFVPLTAMYLLTLLSKDT